MTNAIIDDVFEGSKANSLNKLRECLIKYKGQSLTEKNIKVEASNKYDDIRPLISIASEHSIIFKSIQSCMNITVEENI